jgi:hypothetical protein
MARQRSWILCGQSGGLGSAIITNSMLHLVHSTCPVSPLSFGAAPTLKKTQRRCHLPPGPVPYFLFLATAMPQPSIDGTSQQRGGGTPRTYLHSERLDQASGDGSVRGRLCWPWWIFLEMKKMWRGERVRSGGGGAREQH